MRRTVARVLTTIFLLVAAVPTKSSLFNSLSDGVGLDVDEQKTQQHEPDTAPPASSAPVPIPSSSSPDSVLVQSPLVPGPGSAGTNGVDHEALVQDVANGTSRDGTQRGNAVLGRGAGLNSSFLPPNTTTVGSIVGHEVQQAGPTLDNLQHTVNYGGHGMINDVNDATGNTKLTKDTDIGMSGAMPVNTVNTVDAAVENMTHEGSFNFTTTLEHGTPIVTSSVTDTISSVVANTTGTVGSTLGGTKGTKVDAGSTVNAMTSNVDLEANDGHLTLDRLTPTVKESVDTVSSTAEGAVEQEAKRTMNSTDVPVSSIVPTLAHPVRSSLTTMANTTLNRAKNLASVDADGTTPGTTGTNTASNVIDTVAPGVNTLVYTVANPAGSVNDSKSKPLTSAVETVVKTADLINQSTSNAASTSLKIVAPVVNTTGSAVKMVPTVVPAALKTGSPLVGTVKRKKTDTAGTTVNTVPATAPAVVNSITITADSAVNSVTNTTAKPVTVADKADSTLKPVSHSTSTVVGIVPPRVNTTKSTMNLRPPSVPTVVPIANNATRTVTGLANATVNTVTKPSLGGNQAVTPQADKVINTVTPSTSTVTNTIEKSGTPAVETMDKPAELLLNTETTAAPAVHNEEMPGIDTITSTIPKLVPTTETKRGVDEVVPGTVPNPAATMVNGTPEVSTNTEGAQESKPTAVKIKQPLMFKNLSTTTAPASPLTLTEQALKNEDERPTSSDEKEVVPSGTRSPDFNDKSEAPIDSIDSQSSLEPTQDTSTNNEVYDSDQAGSQDTQPPTVPVDPSKPSAKALVPTPFTFSDIQSSTEPTGSFDALAGSLASVQGPDVGEPSTTLPSTSEAPSGAPALSLPHILALSPPAPSSSGSKEHRVSQEAQARQANVSGKAHTGSSIVFTVVGVAGCAAIVAIVAFRKKSRPDARSTDVRSLISSADGARASLDSVYTDPLGTRYSSIVMITPNGDGVCIL